MPAQLGINGFGRSGMLVLRAASANPDVKVNAVNDPFMPLDYIVNQLQYDSVHERCLKRIARGSSSSMAPQPGLPREGPSCHRLGNHWLLYPLVFATFAQLMMGAKWYPAPTQPVQKCRQFRCPTLEVASDVFVLPLVGSS